MTDHVDDEALRTAYAQATRDVPAPTTPDALVAVRQRLAHRGRTRRRARAAIAASGVVLVIAAAAGIARWDLLEGPPPPAGTPTASASPTAAALLRLPDVATVPMPRPTYRTPPRLQLTPSPAGSATSTVALTLTGSSSCPPRFRAAETHDDVLYVALAPLRPGASCTDDAVPHQLRFDVDTPPATVRWAVVESSGGAVRIPVERPTDPRPRGDFVRSKPSDVIGTWRFIVPGESTGSGRVLTPTLHAPDQRLTFTPRGTWTAADSCGTTRGLWSLVGGRFLATTLSVQTHSCPAGAQTGVAHVLRDSHFVNRPGRQLTLHGGTFGVILSLRPVA